MTTDTTSDPLPCAKRCFSTEGEAVAEVRKIRAVHGRRMRAYKCHCGSWHMTKAEAPHTRRARHQRRT